MGAKTQKVKKGESFVVEGAFERLTVAILSQNSHRNQSKLEKNLEYELRMTLGQLRRQRDTLTSAESSLLQERFYVYKELSKQKKEAWYRPEKPNQIDQLTSCLHDLAQESRSIKQQHLSSIEKLEGKLVALMNQHSLTSSSMQSHGNRKFDESAFRDHS